MEHSYWYFPGDPPVLDLLLDVGLLVLALGIVLFVVAFLLRARERLLVRIASFVIAILGLAMATPGAVVVGYRHSDTWEPARSAIRHYDRVIGEAVKAEGSEQPFFTRGCEPHTCQQNGYCISKVGIIL